MYSDNPFHAYALVNGMMRRGWLKPDKDLIVMVTNFNFCELHLKAINII